MKYKIIKHSHIKHFKEDNLTDDVNKHIEEGWKPLGGVCVIVESASVSGYNHIIYHQALTKE